MASPTLISVVTVSVGTSATPGAQAVTVPSDATGVILFAGQYSASGASMSGLTSTFGTFSSGNKTEFPSTPVINGVLSWWANVTATGSQTFTPVWTNALLQGPAICLAFFKDLDTTWVRDAGSVQSDYSTASDTLTTAVGDIVIRYETQDGGTAPGTASGWTSVSTPSQNSIGARVSTIVAAGTTQGATTTTSNFPGLALLAIVGASAGTSHAATGALVGPGSTVAGSAAHSAAHASSGALVGPGSAVVGSAARTRAHSATGALTGPGSTVSGAAQHNVPHASSGALTGPGSTVVGTSARTRVHPASGDLVGPGSTVSGTAARTRAHASSGALTGPGSVVDGAAARTRQHAASGDLTGPGSVIVGDADHQGAAGTHDATGALVGPGSTFAGSAARFRAFAASGALTGQGSVIAGSAARVAGSVSHAATGVLVGPGSVVNGSAARADPPVSHNATGVLVGPGSLLSGQAQNGEVPDTPFGGGFFSYAWRRKLMEDELREQLKELPEPVAEVIERQVIKAEGSKLPSVKEFRATLERENIPYRQAYQKALLSLAKEMRQREEDDEEEEAIAIAMASLV